MEIDKKAVGLRIKGIRNSLNETLEKFGKRFNTSKTTVFNWEAGRNLPNNENLKILVNIPNSGYETINHLLYGSSRNYIKSLLSEKYSDDLSIIEVNHLANQFLMSNPENEYPSLDEIESYVEETLEKEKDRKYKNILLMAKWLRMTRESIKRFADKAKENNSLNDEEQGMVNDIETNLKFVEDQYSIIHGLYVEDALEELKELEQLRDKE